MDEMSGLIVNEEDEQAVAEAQSLQVSTPFSLSRSVSPRLTLPVSTVRVLRKRADMKHIFFYGSGASEFFFVHPLDQRSDQG